MSSDVRDILELGQPTAAASSSQQPVYAKVTSGKKKKMKRLIEPIKRPQGVHREVWGLMCKYDSDQPPLIPTQEPKVYKHPKANLRHGVRRWHFVEFKNPARSDSATFSHWRCVNDDPAKEYPFAKFNKQVNVLKYTDAEYAQYLSHDDNWSRAETDHLFELAKRFDLRFYIISDRWDPAMFPPANRKRTIDELKDRYYKVVGILQRYRGGVDESQIYVFDFEHEHKRREQLEKLFNRSKEQVDEELYLMEELKKIEIRKKERERKQQDINKLLTAAVDMDKGVLGKSSAAATAGALANQKNRTGGVVDPRNPAAAAKRLKQRKFSTSGGGANKSAATESGNTSLNTSLDNINLSPSQVAGSNSAELKNKKAALFKTVVESTGIKFPDAKTTGVALRSYKMKLPQSVGLKKLKVIEQLLDELQIEQKPIATENICEQFNELRSDIVLLYELQQALTNYEFELQTLRHRYESIAPGKTLEPTPFESSLASSTSSLFSSLASANTPQKRITEIFDSSLTPTGPLERRRRAALNQTNILKKLRGRNP